MGALRLRHVRRIAAGDDRAHGALLRQRRAEDLAHVGRNRTQRPGMRGGERHRRDPALRDDGDADHERDRQQRADRDLGPDGKSHAQRPPQPFFATVQLTTVAMSSNDLWTLITRSPASNFSIGTSSVVVVPPFTTARSGYSGRGP